jgi:hypothetical protein
LNSGSTVWPRCTDGIQWQDSQTPAGSRVGLPARPTVPSRFDGLWREIGPSNKDRGAKDVLHFAINCIRSRPLKRWRRPLVHGVHQCTACTGLVHRMRLKGCTVCRGLVHSVHPIQKLLIREIGNAVQALVPELGLAEARRQVAILKGMTEKAIAQCHISGDRGSTGARRVECDALFSLLGGDGTAVGGTAGVSFNSLTRVSKLKAARDAGFRAINSHPLHGAGGASRPQIRPYIRGLKRARLSFWTMKTSRSPWKPSLHNSSN